MKKKMVRAMLSGFMATIAMTAFVYIAGRFDLPRTDVFSTMSSLLGKTGVIAWIAYFVMGMFWGGIYGFFLQRHLPGESWMKGAVFGLVPWFAAGCALPIVMGGSLFGGSAMAAVGSLVTYTVFGATLGASYKEQ